MTIAAILKHKGSAVASVAPSDSIAALAHTLHERRIGAVLVLNAGGHLLGIVSERDIVAHLARHGAATLDMTAAQLMTTGLHTATRATTVPEAMALMTSRRVRHLPIVEDGHLHGLVSIGDVVKAHADLQAHEVDALKAYVAGG